MIFNAVVNGIPYIEVSARNDDEARRRVIERCRRERSDGFCKRWKSGGMAVRAKQSNNSLQRGALREPLEPTSLESWRT